MRLSSFPHRAALLALLVWSPIAVARAPVARVRREQQLVLSERPAGTELELRLAPSVTTVVRFDADVERAELKGEGPGRAVRMDVAARSLLLEPREELPPGEAPWLDVVLAEGPARVRLRFLLVSHPSEVDSQVDVELRPRSARPPPEPESPVSRSEVEPFSRFMLSQDLKDPRVSTIVFKGKAVGTGVTVQNTWDCRTGRKRLFAMHVFNPVGASPWLASEVVRLPPADGGLGRSGRWTVAMEGPIAPGSVGRVVVAVPEEEEEAAASVRVEVREKDGGRSLLVEEDR